MKSWLKKYIDEEGLARIELAVKEVEKKTSAEIIPVVSRSSSTVGHVPLVLILLFSLIFIFWDITSYQFNWLESWSDRWWLPYVIFLFNVSFVLASTRWLCQFSWVNRIFTPKGDQVSQVEQLALNQFYVQDLTRAEHGTGVLIFVSLMEKRVVVLGGKSISKKLPPETWDKAKSAIVGGVKEKDLAEGICRGLALMGGLLAENFPIQADDRNEFQDRLVILD